MKFPSKSLAATLNLGQILGRLAIPGDVYCLIGDLGAGKTSLAQGIGKGLEIEDPISSPTFTLIHEYQGRLPLYHMDLYRMNGPEEGEELGLPEYFWGTGVCVVEWPQHAAKLLPDDILEIDIAFEKEGRMIQLIPHGVRSRQIVKDVTELVDPKY